MGPKKKLSKKEKARLEAEQAELLRIELEKEKHRKLEEERERKQREREEAQKRQQQEIIENKIRRKQLKESVMYFDQIKYDIDNIKKEDRKQSEWEHYMRCNGLPNVQNPGDLRKYIHMWLKYSSDENLNERNWLLKTNERTLLTQNHLIENLSRENLRKQQGNLGDTYSLRIREILGILSELELTIFDENLREIIRYDLIHLKSEIRILLTEFINDFTYRILSHIERDMELDSPGTSKHIYESDVFKTQIWALQGEGGNINQKDKFKDETRHTEIDFQLLELQLSLPPIVKLANSAIRGLWLNYDHFSDYCKSFRMPNIKKNHLNILQQTKKEWKKRKEILQTTLDETNLEINIDTFNIEQLQQQQQQRNQQQSRIIDIDKIYTEYEDEMNKLKRKKYNLKSLNLTEFDVNLRSHRVISGVYCIDYLEQPQQDKRLDSQSFIRTIVYPNKLTTKDFYQSYKPPPPPQPGVRRLPEEIEAEMRMVERNLDKLAMVTLQLPEKVLWFEPPIVCRWETLDETLESEIDEKPNYQMETKEIVRKKKLSIKKMESRKKSLYENFLEGNLKVKEIHDFNMFEITKNLNIYNLLIDFIVPRLPNGYMIRIEYDLIQNERKDSFVRYLKRNSINDQKEKIEIINKYGVTIKENLIETNSPRAFYPRNLLKKVLKIHPQQQKQQESQEIHEEERNNENVKEIYMFSQLVEDLDEICNSQIPYFIEERIEVINTNLQSFVNKEEQQINENIDLNKRRFSGLIIIRETDLEKNLNLNRIDQEIDDGNDLTSGSEFEDENDTNLDKDLDSSDNENEILSFGNGKWSTRNVHDVKFNEDKLSIQFRTGRLGYFGFAANRYSNIPYQTWEIKPDFKTSNTVNFSLTAAVISLDISITKFGFCVNTFQGGQTDLLTNMIGRVILLDELKTILKISSADIFPELDAFSYTEGSCEKNYVMEMHLYNCMSSLSLSHNFSWSRWNLLSGSRTAVLLMRELIEGKKIPNHSTLLVTPLKASVVDCTEVSASFNTTGIPGMEYYADLYHLTKSHSQQISKLKQSTIDPVLRDNVGQILMSTRPLSFC